jgi:hypothetical protein
VHPAHPPPPHRPATAAAPVGLAAGRATSRAIAADLRMIHRGTHGRPRGQAAVPRCGGIRRIGRPTFAGSDQSRYHQNRRQHVVSDNPVRSAISANVAPPSWRRCTWAGHPRPAPPATAPRHSPDRRGRSAFPRGTPYSLVFVSLGFVDRAGFYFRMCWHADA